MLGSIARNCLLPHGKRVLLKRYNVSLVAYNIRSKSNVVSLKDQSTTLEAEDDNDLSKPIKYSTSKAARMEVYSYREPYADIFPWYQAYIVMVSLSIFMIYFGILREENDIDLMLYNTDLIESLIKKENIPLGKDGKTLK